MTKQEYMKMLQEKLESFGQGLQEIGRAHV